MNTAEEYLQLQMRLGAIELHLCKLFAIIAESSGVTPDQLATGLRQFSVDSQNQLFAGLDPAMSDLFSAEWANAVDRLANVQIVVAKELSRPKANK